MNNLKNRLKELRKAKKLSQKEFAKAFNNFIREYKDYAVLDNNGKVKKVSQATISRWEVGKTPIPTKYYEALANFFNVPLAYIQGAGYSKKEIEHIILDEINLRLANSFIYGDMEDNELSIVLYNYLYLDKPNLKLYLKLCGETVIRKHKVPTLNAELEELYKGVYSFLFKEFEEFIFLNVSEKGLKDRRELDDVLSFLVRGELDELNESRLTVLGKWFEKSYYLEDANSSLLNEWSRSLKNAKILNKKMESNLHDSMIDDIKYCKDSAEVISSLKLYKDYIEELISEVKSKMNILDAESKKENKDQQ